jgi:hypothetical protein
VKNNRGTIYDLMSSHGDKHNLIKLTIINKDFERVIRHHIHKNNYLEGTDEKICKQVDEMTPNQIKDWFLFHC